MSEFQPNPNYDWNCRNQLRHQGYSVGVWIGFCRFFKSSAYSYEEQCLLETYTKCCSLPQVMFEWGSKYDWNCENQWRHQGYSLRFSIDFYQYLKSSAYSYEEECFAETPSECSSLTQVMLEWVSTKSKLWLKLRKSLKTPRLCPWCLNWFFPTFQIIGLLIWRGMSCRNFYWLFITNPSYVWVSFKLWLKLLKSFKTPRIALVSELIFEIIGLVMWRITSCRNFYWVFLTTQTNVWLSFTQIQNMIQISKSNEPWCLVWFLPIFQINGLLIWRGMSSRNL